MGAILLSLSAFLFNGMEATKNRTALTAIKHGQTITIAFLVEFSFASPPNASLIGSTMIGKFPPTMFIRKRNKAILKKRI